MESLTVSDGTATPVGSRARLKVALFTDTFGETNGAAHTLRRVADEARRQGFSFDVFARGQSFHVAGDEAGRTISFDHRVSIGYYEDLRQELVPDSRVDHAFWQRFRSSGYDLVHIATPGSIGFAGRRLALQAGLPMVGTYHTHLADYASLRLPKFLAKMARAFSWTVMRRFYENCHCVLFPTVGAADLAKQNGFKMRLDIFSRGVETERFHPRHRQRESPRPLVTYVGRLAPEKNVRILPEVLDEQDADVQIVGDGPERAWLERSLPKASFLGYRHGDELSQAYADSDILLFPSLTDTFGNVVLEAMASQVVPIVMEAPGPRDFVTDGDNALIAKDAGGMREALKRLLAHPEERRTMAKRARVFAESRSWSQATRSLFDAYEAAVAPA